MWRRREEEVDCSCIVSPMSSVEPHLHSLVTSSVLSVLICRGEFSRSWFIYTSRCTAIQPVCYIVVSYNKVTVFCCFCVKID